MPALFFVDVDGGGPMSLSAGVDSTRFRLAAPVPVSTAGAARFLGLTVPLVDGLVEDELGMSREPAGESRSCGCCRLLAC